MDNNCGFKYKNKKLDNKDSRCQDAIDYIEDYEVPKNLEFENGIRFSNSVKLGIVVYRFPAKSNTFVVNELIELLKSGIDFHIYSISPPELSDLEAYEDKMHYFKDRVTYVSNNQLFKWGDFIENEIPISRNPIRRSWTRSEASDIKQRERYAIKRAAKPLRLLIADMKAKGVTKLYSPFANLGAEVCLMISQATKLPFFFTCHSHDLFNMDGYGELKMEKASTIFCISQYNKDYIVSKYGIDPEKIIVKRVNYILPDPNIIPSNDLGHPYIFGAGRLIPMKGFELGIRAFKKISKKFPELHYYIAGTGILEDSLVNLIRDLGMSDRIHLLGHIPNEEILTYIKNSSFTMLTSVIAEDGDTEGIPTFFIESMACGVPSIGTNYSGIPELIDDGKNGFLVKIGNINSVVKSMKKLYKLVNSNSKDIIRDNCKITIDEKFNNKTNTKILRNVFVKSFRGDYRK